MRTPSRYRGSPVVVIGNGPVGQTAALLLARWGIPVVLLDQRPARDAVGSKAICQQRDVLDVWAAAGAPEIAAEGLTWTTARTFYRDRELFAWSFVDPGSSPLPAFVNISQSRTEQLLDERIAAQPLIDVRWDHEVTSIDQDGDGVTLTCANQVRVQASYAVAATGARCVLRDLLGVSFDGSSFDDLFLICDIRADLPGWESERRFYFDPSWNPGRQVLIHPCPGSTYRIDWQVPAGYDLAEEERSGALDARIRKIIGDRPYEIVWKTVYRFHARLVDRMRAGRVLLAGDCAHLVAPFGARGLNSGVLDAENAAWKLAFVLRGWAPESLLDTYHDERHAAALENLDVTSATMRFLVPPDDAARRARHELLQAAATNADARSKVNSGRLAEPFWYVDSPLTTADPSRPFMGRPERGKSPATCPGVLIPDVPIHDPDRPEVTRLREIVRDGVLALTTDGVSTTEVTLALKNAIDAPSRVLSIEAIDSSGTLTTALGARPGEVWLIRPDGHVAATIPDPTAATITAAARRSLGSQR
ncbi:pentachlorophenol monooxygenase/3-(3-hydroxy-phenyl)propionate hydroxylase [Kribbella sp. VKM Ac-2527]|uniref:Pentachlorophenol monooxygenase/3-(3-hydroxy-phenyl)propionate hydroxylase n=1 Tax=Kribbella caucasensis TaxID=2512215 RepID=A0A4R6J6C4_9ACTN|nr:FAD-dependent monooxygenase [Kribbella sp. VKM Ac-2527]TDO30992.1 pentachlorophenol monooxygenase/3-(3-hydroxy-phenyl)propionate hydroxylase [Kribbella sp. VKM Ac-2527]